MSEQISLGKLIYPYRVALQNPYIQLAYEKLVKYVMSLKAHAQKTYPERYSFGNISPGYMDYTYFPFADDFLRSRKLRFGVVLNHKALSFELWLMGQNIEVQKEYWNLLKSSSWNKHKKEMPKYSVLEVAIVPNPNFDDLERLTEEISTTALSTAEEIHAYLHFAKNHWRQ